MVQVERVNPSTTNLSFPQTVPITGQPLDSPAEISSDVAPKNESQSWKTQVIVAKPQFQECLRRKLEEIRQEAEEAYTLDNEIDPVPESAYNDALFLLEEFFHFDVPTPDLSWAEDGSLSLGWYPGEGTATMGIYGDNLVIYTVFFEEKRQFEGICELSDTPMLSGFLTMLGNILS